MTKAIPAGRTLTEDPPASCPGGNPKQPKGPAWYLGRLPGTKSPERASVSGLFFLLEHLVRRRDGPATTKTYVRELERFGGEAAVLFDEFNGWFAARWHGKL